MKDFVVEYWVEVLFGLIVGGFAWGYRRLAKKLCTQRHREDAIAQGVQALLRNEIIRTYEKCVAQGYCSIETKENVQRLYEAYHALGGNGTITELVNRLLKMPEEE